MFNAVNNATNPYPNVGVQTRAQYEASQVAKVNQLLGIVYALLALAVLIALIGIVNTLLLSVFERTHEIGLLRAVGMKRRQIRAMIRSEAVILALLRGDHRHRGGYRPGHGLVVLAQEVAGDHRRLDPLPQLGPVRAHCRPARAGRSELAGAAGGQARRAWRPSLPTDPGQWPTPCSTPRSHLPRSTGSRPSLFEVVPVGSFPGGGRSQPQAGEIAVAGGSPCRTCCSLRSVDHGNPQGPLSVRSGPGIDQRPPPVTLGTASTLWIGQRLARRQPVVGGSVRGVRSRVDQLADDAAEAPQSNST